MFIVDTMVGRVQALGARCGASRVCARLLSLSLYYYIYSNGGKVPTPKAESASLFLMHLLRTMRAVLRRRNHWVYPVRS
jgi:hypothetical protein